ncbi:hypothetical protein ACSVDA_15575 [Cytobacillus sp. Hm23]
MALMSRERLPDGTFGPLKKVFENDFTVEEQVAGLGEQLALAKIENIQKDTVINSLGQELALLKIEVMQLKGGE